MTKSLVLIPAALALFAPAVLSAADAPLVADTYTSGVNPNINFGGLVNLSVGNAAANNVALVKFDLSVLPSAPISRATLRVFVNKIGTPGAVDVLAVTSPWVEGTITGQFPATLGGAVATAIPVTTAGEYLTVDVTTLVQNQVFLSSFYPNNGFAIIANASAPNTAIFFDSKENTSTSHPATLDITLAGPQGPQGPTGPSGPTGAAGPTGAQGPVGPAGLTGAQGPGGPIGITGAQGSAGAQGPQGATGPQGAPGASSSVLLAGASVAGDLTLKTPGTIAHFTPDQDITITRISVDQLTAAAAFCPGQAVFLLTNGAKGEDAVVSPGQTQYDSGAHSLTFPANVPVRLDLSAAPVCDSGTHAADANILVQYRAAVAGDTDACPASTLACSGVCAATQYDSANCGSCGHTCGAVANGATSCQSGACGIASCNAGFVDCNNNAADGCETNATNNVNNCGSCGHTCGGPNVAAPSCTAGTCGILQCNAGFADCNNNAADGCETNATNNVNNCGSCGHTCSGPNVAAPSCTAGTCGILQCNAGFADCNNNAADGCETNATNNVNNCGSCGHACGGPNVAAPSCTAGTCGILQCNAGFADCNNNAADGCETNLTNSFASCGTCGHTCTAGQVCQNGTCI